MNAPQGYWSFSLMSLEFRIRDLLWPPLRRLREVGVMPGQTVLDFGCGHGGFSIAASQIVGPAGKVLAADFNPMAVRAVERAARSKGLINITTVVGSDLVALPDQSVDVAIVFDVLHDLAANSTKVVAGLHRVIKPEGVLLVSDHHLNEAGILSSITSGGMFALDQTFLGRIKVYRFNRVSRGD